MKWTSEVTLSVEQLLDLYMAAWLEWYEAPLDETEAARELRDVARARLLAAATPSPDSPVPSPKEPSV